jgi:hypothetical protein
MTDVLRYVKGLTRFDYWNYPLINPLLEKRSPPFDTPEYTVDDLDNIVHKQLSTRYQKAHEAGDSEAIFAYFKADGWAFSARWVVQQIEDWRHEATPESRKKLHRLMPAYTDDRGRVSLPETVRLIKRDQAIFKEIINLHQEEHLPLKSSRRSVGCFTRVGEQYNLSKEGVKEIYEAYKWKADELLKGYRRLPAPKRRKSLEQAFVDKWGERPDWEMLEKRRQQDAKPRLASREEFFQWLDTMAERLERLLGGCKSTF